MFAPENELVPENGLKMISQTERGAFNHLTANVPPKMGLFKLLKEKYPTPHIFMFSSSESNWEESVLTCDV
ncbi:unnamed protein product [Pocillopora meandrina]|uniref:Uncharacterized protein n=1 Tax=Pocillopora meandrina TaxID=46732 RepID=A0AAU9WKE5_9CNID|nr:unnamed protein product [Pocillopora meandrina]